MSDGFLLGYTVECRLQLKAPIAIFPVCKRLNTFPRNVPYASWPSFACEISIRLPLGYSEKVRWRLIGVVLERGTAREDANAFAWYAVCEYFEMGGDMARERSRNV